MAISKKLEIIYHNGQPDGIRSIRRHLSTMTTYVIPRPLLSEAKKLTGINRPGIYYLISETDDNKIAQIYVGQTRNGVSRLDDHNRSKDFWNKAIMFLADNKTFSLDMISGLEAFAIGKAIEAKRYKVENTVNPKYEIDEYDLPLIEEVYEEIKFIMATQGYKMENSKTTLNEANTLHTTRNGVQALGVYDGEKFEVLEGSASETIIVRISALLSTYGVVPALLAGVILAGILASTMSTADSQLIAATSAVSKDLFEVFKVKTDAKKTMKTARLTLLIIAVIAAFIARNPDSSVFGIVSFAWAGFGASFGPVVLFALFWRRSNKYGAIAGMATGGIMVFVWKYLVKPLGGIWNIYELLPAFIVASIAIVVVSLLTEAPSKEITEEFDLVKNSIN